MKLNRKQWSLLISFFIMMLVLLTLFNIHLSAKEDKEILYELRFEDPKKPEKTSSPEEDKLETHMAYNESVKSRFDKEVREFKTLEELKEGKKSDEAEENEENEEAETSDEIPSEPQQDYMSSETGESVASRATRNKKQQAEKSEGDNTSDTKVENNSVNHHSSISYSLVNRVHRSLPNPVYTCSARGKIVINIKVDALGNVTDASFNKRSSTSGNGCLVEHAITYALRAKFEEKEGNDSQVGTITYLFQG
ncbi:hypothetical protein SAMN02927921_01259 [Sinomicrobium oceani]|uniref:TonB family C-terminal domain-containing protein n=1 Tax=Sinomicrobium oceani TaxID=1150368 RepID=A0A1K1NGA4_9FLAO|nr:hypothetical protein [Sinomicrobium oceani]SFW34297.1 hypothetical protein SAMN02927921_01259 [Sinomicrobium oceani]